MIRTSATELKNLAPNAKSLYLDAFQQADTILAKYGINDSALRLAHFMAQVLHESGGLTVLEENMNYTTTKRLQAVWPARFPTAASANPYVKNPQALANKVYNGRMGNKTSSDDGWNFRGRGLMQLTGRSDYKKYGDALGVDLTASPELAIDSRYALSIAAAEWDSKKANKLADADDITAITKKINGGEIGLDSRKKWLKKTKQVWKGGSDNLESALDGSASKKPAIKRSKIQAKARPKTPRGKRNKTMR